MHMRPYAGLDDLARMKALVSMELQAGLHSGSHHPGDLDWWLFYGAQDADWRKQNMLWEDEGELLGWVNVDVLPLLQFDMALHPRLRGTDAAAALVRWGEEQLASAAHELGKPVQAFAWADDVGHQRLMRQLGYEGGEDYMICFAYLLAGATPVPQLPDGFRFLEQMTPEWVDQRGGAHFDAFAPSKMTPAKYARFMEAPNYDASLDVCVVAPDGTLVTFAMCWVDEASGVGHFEPVGTRTAMQRRGLGRAALHEGLRRLGARGMSVATVQTSAEDAENVAFYTNCGFTPVNSILKYEKTFEKAS